LDLKLDSLRDKTMPAVPQSGDRAKELKTYATLGRYANNMVFLMGIKSQLSHSGE